MTSTLPPLPTLPDIGFRAWSTYVTQVEDLTVYEATPNSGQRVGWLGLQPVATAPMGTSRKGIQPDGSAPPTGPGQSGGKPAYWEQLQARINIIQNQPTQATGALRGLTKALQNVQQHWIGAPT